MSNHICNFRNIAVLLCLTIAGCTDNSVTELPYDSSNPVIYDNDWANDYIDYYLMALASAGDIQYLGISTSSSIPPYNRHMVASDLAMQRINRVTNVETGRASGLRHIPDPVAGSSGNLQRPTSGITEDTQPLPSPGSEQIIAAAHATRPEKPLVVIVGGPLTTVASAWLMDHSIADKLIVAWVDNYNEGMTGFNGWSDGWAAYIVLERLQLVQFTAVGKPFAQVPNDQLARLPPSPARERMLESEPDILDSQGDVDGPPAIPLMRGDYLLTAKRVSFGGWKERDGHQMPLFRDDRDGRAIVVTSANRDVATEEWWRAIRNPAAWHGK
jgi:hypothetical protein